MEVKELQSRIEGKVTIATDAEYEHLRCEINWNQLMPIRDRHERHNPVIALFKLGERDHRNQLLNEGHVYINPVSKFRSNPDEGAGYCRQENGAPLSMHHEAEWRTIGTLRGPIRITDRSLAKMNCSESGPL